MKPSAAYDQIAKLATDAALILETAGGVITICHPDVQREEGIYCHVQWVHGKGEHPDRDGVCKCKSAGKGACKSSGAQ